MREVLFRGKSIDSGEWVEGGYYCEKIGEYITATFIAENLTSQVIGHERVDRKTVGQFTGLTDKNGKKIFEGDIVKYGDTIHEVVFEQRNETAYFGMVYSEIETLPFGHYQDLRQIEVIGNIHDNPELISGDENAN